MITLPSGVIDLLEEGRFSVRYLVKFSLDSGDHGVWNGDYAITVSSVVYDQLAGNVLFDGIPGTSELSSENVKITVSNLLSAVTTVVAGEDWHQRPCTLYVAFMNEDGSVLHVETVFSGFIDDAAISDAKDDLSTLGLFIESNNRELNRATGRTRSDADQRRVAATDGFFKHAANANADTDIYWGRKGPQSPTRTSRG